MKSILLMVVVLSIQSISFGQEGLLRLSKGGKIYRDGVKLHRLDVDVIITRSPEAHALWKKAKTNRGAANLFGVIGGFGLGWALGSAISPPKSSQYSSSSSVKKDPEEVTRTMTIIGAAGIVAWIPFAINANNKAKEAVDAYNEAIMPSSSYQSFWRLEGGFQGLGLSFHF